MSVSQVSALIAEGHTMAGRIAAANTPNIATFCRCGRAYFGCDVDQADERWAEHVRTEVTIATVEWRQV